LERFVDRSKNLRTVVTVVAVGIAAVHICVPSLKIDSITVVLLVIAALPWLQPLIKSIELLGVKLELQEIKEQLATAKGAAESATQKAAFALSTAQRSDPADMRQQSRGGGSINELITEYNDIRSTQRSGDSRTAAMTSIVRKMIDVAAISDFDVSSALQNSNGGSRLAAYAYLYQNPSSKYLSQLVDCMLSIENKPFTQYWGIQAIGKVVEVTKPIPMEVFAKIQNLGERFPQGTDRQYEIRKVLNSITQTREAVG
jgi:hypothetical protein